MPTTTVLIAKPPLNGESLEPVAVDLAEDGMYSMGSHEVISFPITIGISLPDPTAEPPWQPANLTLEANGSYRLERISRSAMTGEHQFNELAARYMRFKNSTWHLQPSSYQIRNSDLSPGGWIAQVHVWHDTHEASTVQPLQERDPKIYGSKGEADFMAMRIGVRWLETNVGGDA